MKKLFLYVFLGLLWCNISYSATISASDLVSPDRKSISDIMPCVQSMEGKMTIKKAIHHCAARKQYLNNIDYRIKSEATATLSQTDEELTIKFRNKSRNFIVTKIKIELWIKPISLKIEKELNIFVEPNFSKDDYYKEKHVISLENYNLEALDMSNIKGEWGWSFLEIYGIDIVSLDETLKKKFKKKLKKKNTFSDLKNCIEKHSFKFERVESSDSYKFGIGDWIFMEDYLEDACFYVLEQILPENKIKIEKNLEFDSSDKLVGVSGSIKNDISNDFIISGIYPTLKLGDCKSSVWLDVADKVKLLPGESLSFKDDELEIYIKDVSQPIKDAEIFYSPTCDRFRKGDAVVINSNSRGIYY